MSRDEDDFGLSGVQPRDRARKLRRAPGDFFRDVDKIISHGKKIPAFPDGSEEDPSLLLGMPRARAHAACTLDLGRHKIQPTIHSLTLTKRFRGERIISVGDSDDLLLCNLFVGNRSQFARGFFPIPLADFLPHALSSGLFFDDCEPGVQIAAQVRNDSRQQREIHLLIFGRLIP